MTNKVKTKDTVLSERLAKATGPIPYGFMNDYMFHNPIEPGADYSDKEYILDLKLLMNDKAIINIEIQVENLGDWNNRSLCYLCRNFVPSKGDDYNTVPTVIHIGILDFDVFKNTPPEFYYKNLMMSTRSHRIYNDRFRLMVLQLNHIQEATDDDRAWHIDEWARLFKAKTWEELKMLSMHDALTEASECLYVLNEDEIAQNHARAREELRVRLECQERRIKEAEAKADAAEAKLEYYRNLLEQNSIPFD